MEVSVHKATKSSKVEPPKRKHVRAIIVETWKENGGFHFLTELFRRPLDSSDVACWKGLVTLHTVLKDGHPGVLDDCYLRTTLLESLRNEWNRQVSSKGINVQIITYINFLLEKITFHHIYKGIFPPDFDLEKFVKSSKDSTVSKEKRLQSVIHMLDLQNSIHNLFKKIVEDKKLDDFKVCALLPLVIESYNIYTIEVHLIKKLVQELDLIDVLTHLIERFYGQYFNLRTFYFDVSTMKSISSIIAVPMLPKDPPVFTKPKDGASPKSSPRHVRRVKKDPAQPTNIQTQQGAPRDRSVSAPVKPVTQTANFTASTPALPTQAQTTPVVHYSMPNLPQPMQPAQSASYNPFTGPSTLPPTSTAVVSTPPKPVQPQPVVNPQKKDFSDLLAMVNNMKVPANVDKKKKEEEEQKKKEEEMLRLRTEEMMRRREAEDAKIKERIRKEQEERIKKEEEDRRKKRDEERRRKEDEERKKREEEDRIKREEEEKKREAERVKRDEERLQQEQERIRQIVQEEASKEIRELKVRIVELENSVDREKEISKDSNRHVSELEARIAKLQEELQRERQEKQELRAMIEERDATIARLTDQISRMNRDYESLSNQYSSFKQAQKEQDLLLLSREFTSAIESLDMHTSRLDNPTNLGNPSATIQDVVDDTSKMATVLDSFTKSCDSGSRENYLDSVKSVVGTASQLLDDAKGASRRIDDNESRQLLLDNARRVAEKCAGLLEFVKDLDFQVKSDEDKKLLVDNVQDGKVLLNELSEAAKASERKIVEKEVEDFESIAEKELLAAAKMIEQAANDLLAAKAKPKPPVEPGVPDVSEAILEAAIAITKATGMLVNSATMAQKERVEKGRTSGDPTSFYHKDPTWAQGLVSAAKSVAMATATLVATANDVVNGKFDEETLIAATKAVASSTAQLVAACRAKSDPNSPSQQKLNVAAKAVTDATSMLVAAAKSVSQRKDDAVEEFSNLNDMQRKVKEMEVQTEILRIEKELEGARKKLFGIRKQQYK